MIEDLQNQDMIETNDLSKNAKGGTEMMLERIFHRLPRDLLENFQIVPTRLTRPLDETRIRIAWIHDLPGDPSCDYLKDKGWNKFHRIVFCSNWQMQNFIGYYGIPWSKCMVMKNAIVPIEKHEKPLPELRLVYTSTPHRGLVILINVFEALLKKYPNLQLDIFSSFKLYGWDERDKEFETLFERCRNNPNITYHGIASNDEVRETLKTAHIFAYPSIWLETSCLCLIEAMSASLICVHPNLGALFETAANHTMSYQFQEDATKHAALFYQCLEHVIENYEKAYESTSFQKLYTDHFYNIDQRGVQWEGLLTSMLDEPRAFEKEIFTYDTSTRRIS
jgi:UDP-glucose:(glucosyl)LPS alpha-1,2-glucosyltransferase